MREALAAQLVGNGHKVTLFLVQNGVLPTRPCAQSQALSDLANTGVEVLADDFFLRERGIDAAQLTDAYQLRPWMS